MKNSIRILLLALLVSPIAWWLHHTFAPEARVNEDKSVQTVDLGKGEYMVCITSDTLTIDEVHDLVVKAIND